MKIRPTLVFAIGWFAILAYMFLFCGCAPTPRVPTTTYSVDVEGNVIDERGTLIDYRFDVGDKARHKCGIDVVVIDRRYEYVWHHAYYKERDEGDVSPKQIEYKIVLFTHDSGLIGRWVLDIELETIDE